MRKGAQFENRTDAGRQLAGLLEPWAGEDTVVLGMARGGVPVACEVARTLGATLEVAVVCKVGAPMHAELAIGAVAEGGVTVLDQRLIEYLHVGQDYLDRTIRSKNDEVARRLELYRQGRPRAELKGRIAILVDDGLATGQSAVAAMASIRVAEPREIVLAFPVCSPESSQRIAAEERVEVVCGDIPPDFYAVGQFYRDFSQTTDPEVVRLLAG